MNRVIHEHLESLYGPATGRVLSERVSALLGVWRHRLPGVPKHRERLDLSQRDALLITYADQVTEPGQSSLRSLAEFCRRHLKGTVSGVHILPFYPWSSDDGFSVKDFFAVEPGYGTWEDIADVGVDFDLMFDAVFNHVSVQSQWFKGFAAGEPIYRDFFIPISGSPDLAQVVRPRALPLLTEFQTSRGTAKVWTTFSADQADLNFKNPEVLLLVLEALLFYVSKGARFIRLDAIAFLWKETGTCCLHLPQTHRVIQLFRAVLDEVAPFVLLITETNVPHADNLSYFGNGANEAQLVYNFALPPLVLHSFSTGNAEKLTRWADSLALPSDQATFFNFLASHDGIGLNPVRGILSEVEIEGLVTRTLQHGGLVSYKSLPDGRQQPYEMNINYLDALSNPAAGESAEVAIAKLLTAHAILYSLQGVPGIYFHSLVGSRGDRLGAETSGIPRRINREKLRRERLEAELRDGDSLRHKALTGQRQLLHLRGQHRALSPAARQRVLKLDPRVFAVLREARPEHDLPGEDMLCLHNVSADVVTVQLDGPSGGHQWTQVWGECQGPSSGGTRVLEPWRALWFAAGSSS